MVNIGVRRGVSKGIEDGHKLPALRVGHCKAVPGVAQPQGVEGSGMADLGVTLGSPWAPLARRP
jgi:hypothetical protein